MKRNITLLSEMKERGLRKKDIAERFGISAGAVSHKFTGKSPWTLDEAYIVLRLLGYEGGAMLPVLFPAEDVNGCKVVKTACPPSRRSSKAPKLACATWPQRSCAARRTKPRRINDSRAARTPP